MFSWPEKQHLSICRYHPGTAASPARDLRGVGVFYLPRPFLAMSYQTTIKQPDGDITAIDVSTTAISNEQSETIAQAVEMIMDGAEREAAEALRELASSIDGRNPEAEVERLREAVKDARCRFIELQHPDEFPSGKDAVRQIASRAKIRMANALDAAEVDYE